MNAYRFASRNYKSEDTIVQVRDVEVGGDRIIYLAGPCTVEDEITLMETAFAVKKAGARILRGGTFKLRTSPYSFQGLCEDGLKLLRDAGQAFSMPVVTEITDVRDLGTICKYAKYSLIKSCRKV